MPNGGPIEVINIELYLAFCAASIALILMPGPVVSLVIANSLRLGTRAGLATVWGASAGNFTLLVCAAVGVTTVLTLMSSLFDVIRLAGAAYLVYLGIKEWRSRGTVLPSAPQDQTLARQRGLAAYAFLIGFTNPKTILFYITFLPQFLDPDLPIAPQLIVLCLTFQTLAIGFDCCYVFLAGKARPYLMDAKRALIRARLTGTLLIATGIGIALSGRQTG